LRVRPSSARFPNQFIESRKGFIRDGRVFFLNREELIEYYHKTLSAFRRLGISAENVHLDFRLTEAVGDVPSDILRCVLETFFRKTDPDRYSLDEQEVLRSVAADLLTSLQRVAYEEYLDVVKKGVRAYLPEDIFQRKLAADLESDRFVRDLWAVVYGLGLVVDYNDYVGDGIEYIDQKNVVAVRVDWTPLIRPKERLKRVAELKRTLWAEEVALLFNCLFESRKDFEGFVRSHFNKVVVPVARRHLDTFRRNNPFAVPNPAAPSGAHEFIIYDLKNGIF